LVGLRASAPPWGRVMSSGAGWSLLWPKSGMAARTVVHTTYAMAAMPIRLPTRRASMCRKHDGGGGRRRVGRGGMGVAQGTGSAPPPLSFSTNPFGRTPSDPLGGTPVEQMGGRKCAEVLINWGGQMLRCGFESLASLECCLLLWEIQQNI